MKKQICAKSVSVGRDVEAKPNYPITVEVMGFADKKDIQISICFVAKTAYGLLDNIVTLPKKDALRLCKEIKTHIKELESWED